MGISFFILIFLELQGAKGVFAAETPAVVITEIAAAAPSEQEWIEIYNTTDTFIDIGEWRFVEGVTASNPEGSRHILKIAQGDALLEPREYAVIAQSAEEFRKEYPLYTGTLFDSSWGSLKESGEQISFVDAGGIVVEEFTYPPVESGVLTRVDPLKNDYSSLNWIEIFSKGTPGEENHITYVSDDAGEEGAIGEEVVGVKESTQNVQDGQNEQNAQQENTQTIAFGKNFVVSVGEEIIFEVPYEAEHKKYSWDFDDGEKAEGKSVSHAYAKEGDYLTRVKFVYNGEKQKEKFRVTVVEEENRQGADTLFPESDEPKDSVLTPASVTTVAQNTGAVIEGVVLVEPGIIADSYFYMSTVEGEVGIQVYSYAQDFPDVHIGQLIRVNGELSQYYRMKRLKIAHSQDIVIIRGQDPPFPLEVGVSNIADAHLTRLIQVEGEVLKTEGKIFIIDGDAKVRVEITERTGIAKDALQEGARARITGVLDATRAGYRLLPRHEGDIEVVSEEFLVAGEKSEGEGNVLGEKTERTEASEALGALEFTQVGDTDTISAPSNDVQNVYRYLIATGVAVALVLVGLEIKKRHAKQKI